MTSISPSCSALAAALPKLPAKDVSFAASLLSQWEKKGGLSSKQMFWVGEMINKANNPAPAPAAPVSVGDFSGVMALFAKARQSLKYPKIVLEVEGEPLQLSLSGPKSKAPGQVNVTDGGPFGSNKWYGRVSASGDFVKSASATPKIEAFLKEFSAAPAAVAKKYGALTGKCCFCNKPLTDPKSTAAGFGPVCADHFGLKSEWKAAQAVFDGMPDAQLIGAADQPDLAAEAAQARH